MPARPGTTRGMDQCASMTTKVSSKVGYDERDSDVIVSSVHSELPHLLCVHSELLLSGIESL